MTCCFLGVSCIPGSSPSGSRVIQREDRVSKEELIYLIRTIKRDQEEIVQQENLVEKRCSITWFMEKANKVPDKELAPSTLGHQHPLEQRGVPHLGLPHAWILEAGASKQIWRASTLQMEIQPEKENRPHRGETSPVTGPSSIVQNGLLYLFLYIEING